MNECLVLYCIHRHTAEINDLFLALRSTSPEWPSLFWPGVKRVVELLEGLTITHSEVVAGFSALLQNMHV